MPYMRNENKSQLLTAYEKKVSAPLKIKPGKVPRHLSKSISNCVTMGSSQ